MLDPEAFKQALRGQRGRFSGFSGAPTMETNVIQLPPAVAPYLRIPSEDLLRRILLILQIIKTKVDIVRLLLVVMTLLVLLGV